MEALWEFLCVNSPNVDSIFSSIMHFLWNEAFIVEFKGKPAIMKLKEENVGSVWDPILQKVLCVYHLPWFDYDKITFKCFSNTCNYQEWIYLDPKMRLPLTHWKDFWMHWCLYNAWEHEELWFYDDISRSFFNQNIEQSMRYFAQD